MSSGMEPSKGKPSTCSLSTDDDYLNFTNRNWSLGEAVYTVWHTAIQEGIRKRLWVKPLLSHVRQAHSIQELYPDSWR